MCDHLLLSLSLAEFRQPKRVCYQLEQAFASCVLHDSAQPMQSLETDANAQVVQ
jgi:hypothetical protein